MDGAGPAQARPFAELIFSGIAANRRLWALATSHTLIVKGPGLAPDGR